MEFDPEKGKYIPRFYLDEYGGSVLGANFMMGHDVLFDVEKFRLGITESDCDYLALLNPSSKKNEKVGVSNNIVDDKMSMKKQLHLHIQSRITILYHLLKHFVMSV